MKTVSFPGQSRDTNVKASSLRSAGQIPAVLYGGKTLEHFTVVHNDIKHLIYTPDFKLGEVDLGGTKHKCIIKDVQFHPVTEDIQHIDFLAIEDGRKVKVNIPIRFKGASPGVKEGGTLMQSMRKVLVKLDPKDIIDELLIDISELQLGSAVKVKDIEIADGMEIMADSSIPVASVEVPRALKSEQSEADAEAGTEGEEGETPAAPES